MELIDVCRMVARSLFAEIGPWGDRCALIGGLTPGLLVPIPNASLQPHVGTRDVDLAISIAAIGDEPEMYRTLKNTGAIGWVTESGFEANEGAREAREAAGIVQEFVRLVRLS